MPPKKRKDEGDFGANKKRRKSDSSSPEGSEIGDSVKEDEQTTVSVVSLFGTNHKGYSSCSYCYIGDHLSDLDYRVSAH